MSDSPVQGEFPFLVENLGGHPIARFTNRGNAQDYADSYLGLRLAVPAVPVLPGEELKISTPDLQEQPVSDIPAVLPDPYAECRCGHGRHTHVHYTGACGLCDCAAVRATPTEPEEKP
jgi:hypothetical protein